MNILFVDHACHLKTKSADFFLEILRREHTVVEHHYRQYYRCDIPREKIDAADLIVFWEFLPGRFRIAIPGKPCLFVPMYDNEWGSKWQWRRIALSGMAVLSFCDAVTRHARACGVKDILTVHYAFDPERFDEGAGDLRQAVYWDRGNFSEETVRALFAPGAVDELTVQREFLPTARYEEFISRFGVYVAPRRKEGIGMAFLEQLARGKCVIAHDDATMSEYVRDGENGFLRDFDGRAKPITAEEIAAVAPRVRASAKTLFERWLRESEQILPFIAKPRQKCRGASLADTVRYCLFLAEGISKRCLGWR